MVYYFQVIWKSLQVSLQLLWFIIKAIYSAIPLQGIPVLFIPGNRGSYRQGVCVRACVRACVCVSISIYV